LIEIGSKTAEKNSAQANKQTDRHTNRHYENNGHLAVNQLRRENVYMVLKVNAYRPCDRKRGKSCQRLTKPDKNAFSSHQEGIRHQWCSSSDGYWQSVLYARGAATGSPTVNWSSSRNNECCRN